MGVFDGGATMNEDILNWARVLDDYARDWDATFRNRPDYFTREFWDLLVGCMVAHAQGQPMTIGAAIQAMKAGSSRTREDRIKRAVDDGFLVKEKKPGDGRSSTIRPTPLLEERICAHLERTLADVRARI